MINERRLLLGSSRPEEDSNPDIDDVKDIDIFANLCTIVNLERDLRGEAEGSAHSCAHVYSHQLWSVPVQLPKYTSVMAIIVFTCIGS